MLDILRLGSSVLVYLVHYNCNDTSRRQDVLPPDNRVSVYDCGTVGLRLTRDSPLPQLGSRRTPSETCFYAKTFHMALSLPGSFSPSPLFPERRPTLRKARGRRRKIRHMNFPLLPKVPLPLSPTFPSAFCQTEHLPLTPSSHPYDSLTNTRRAG